SSHVSSPAVPTLTTSSPPFPYTTLFRSIPAPSDKVIGKSASSEPAAVSEKSASSGQASPVFAPVAGQLLDISRVNDPVFSEKMMGDGYAVEPDTNAKTAKVYAPGAGKIVSIFPRHHALGMQKRDE